MPPLSSHATPLAEPRARYLADGALDLAAEEAIQAFRHEAESANTRRGYAQAYRYWGAWHALRYGKPLRLPVSSDVVCQFLVDHLRHGTGGRFKHLLPASIDETLVEFGYKQRVGPLSLSTVEQRVAALSNAHRRLEAEVGKRGRENPVRAHAVRTLLSSIRRAYAKRGVTTKRPKAATRDALEAMLATCDDSPLGIRDRALLLFGFASGGRRRSEITGATFDNVTKAGRGYVYHLRVSKTNQTGRDDPNAMKPIVGMAAEALRTWLALLAKAKIRSGPIFRRVFHDHIGAGLAPAAVRDIVIRRARLAGLEGGYAAHSLRSGFVTEAGRQQVSLPETMALTGHRSVATVLRYFQGGASATSAAARLLED